MLPIKLELVRPLVDAGAVRTASIIGQKGGYSVVFTLGLKRQPLATRAGVVRVFTRSDTAIQTLHELGIRHFSVDTTDYEAGSLRPSRPDLVKKNQDARAVLEHDRWFREQVQSTLDRMARGEEKLTSHGEVWDGLEAYAHDLVAKRGTSKNKAPITRRKAD